MYEAYHRQLRDRREGSGGTREYIRILMLLKDHPLPKVTATVEQAAEAGVYSYEGVRGWLGGLQDAYRSDSPRVWPNRVDHFDRLMHG